jgi:hypothetical protein
MEGRTDWQRTDWQVEITKILVAFRNCIALKLSSYGETFRNLNEEHLRVSIDTYFNSQT